MTFDQAWRDEPKRALVTTKSLGNAAIPNQPYEQPDGTPPSLATDYAGKKRSETNPFPGPFEPSGDGRLMLKVWPHSGPLTSTKDIQ